MAVGEEIQRAGDRNTDEDEDLSDRVARPVFQIERPPTLTLFVIACH